ncbi:MAG: PD-(D/E)XK nuclease family protein [bacterium]
MAKDKYSAVWVSHSSMGDFLKCPRAYYLHNIYKDPKTRRKMSVVGPALSLGTAVHGVVEGLADFKAEERFTGRDLLAEYEKQWAKVSGEKGGFKSVEDEAEWKARGEVMIERVIAHPGPLVKKALKLKGGQNDMLPNYFLSEDENIILCGKIDWLEYVPEDDSVRVLDFKTGKREEEGESLQLPIYLLLLNELQKRKVSGASYWYLDRDDEPKLVELPSLEVAREKVLTVARAVKAAREKGVFECPRVLAGGSSCFACAPYEAILRGEAKSLGVGEYNQDLFLV